LPEKDSVPLWNRSLPHDARSELFGGTGVVRVWALVGAPRTPFAAVLACELEAGASVGTHVQQQYPELVIAVAGVGSVRVDGERLAFSAGSVVELSLGQTLSIANGSNEEPLRYLIVKTQG
jgi:mannose-6-phosphate isomerase-like protein (cupin superfamily)